jgi:alkanesulfonate monooxygenase SsuD/methylene tetrahydromethanopterin reductase-like flavin-dependent oxidoreductase (luciferase family)
MGLRAPRTCHHRAMSARLPLELGVFVDPSAATLDDTWEIIRIADEAGLDLAGIQDHPYQRRFVDTFALMAFALARTERLRVFPDVANLPLRPPPMLAKAAASLDLLSGGRFELGIGAGAFWEGVGAMGGPVRSGAESVDALEEAIEIIRAAWSGERGVRHHGTHYDVDGWQPGPPPAHPIQLWIGGYGPRMLKLTGRVADGWLPSLSGLPPDVVPARQLVVDEAAIAAGREPSEIRRLYNVGGMIIDEPITDELLRGPVEHWVATLQWFHDDLRFDSFIFWPDDGTPEQVRRFAEEVAPALRAAVG